MQSKIIFSRLLDGKDRHVFRTSRALAFIARSPLPRSAYIHVIADDEDAAASSRRDQKACRLPSWRAMPSHFEGRASSTATTRSCRPFSTTVFYSSRVSRVAARRWPACNTADRRREKTRKDTVRPGLRRRPSTSRLRGRRLVRDVDSEAA